MKLSCAMIVKDEEAMLPGCLESIKRLVDEIVVVDTGSTDKTMQIALKHGAKIMYSPWRNDFSFHRNEAIAACTGDWILIIDADERLLPGPMTKEEVTAAFKALPKGLEVLAVTVRNVNRDGVRGSRFISPRWIRPHLRYAHAKHNELQFSSEAGASDFIIEHYGYDRKVIEEKGKLKRDYHMMKDEFRVAGKIVDQGKRANELARLHHYMSNLFMMDRKWKAGIAHGIAALKCLEWTVGRGQNIGQSTMQLFSKLYHTVGMAYYNLKDLQKAYAWVRHGADMFPANPDYHADLVFIGKAGGNIELVREHAPKYFESLDGLKANPFALGCSMLFMVGEQTQGQVRRAIQ